MTSFMNASTNNAATDDRTCWCSRPAEFVNEETDATARGPVCSDHVADGYELLAPIWAPEVEGIRYVGEMNGQHGFDVRSNDAGARFEDELVGQGLRYSSDPAGWMIFVSTDEFTV